MSINHDKDRISSANRVGYASGNLGKSLFWTSLEYLLLFYMTDLVGIAPIWAGVIIVFSLLWDGITDPLFGYWIDYRSSKGHGYQPYFFWGPLLCAFSFAAIFAVPFTGEAAKIAYLLFANVLFRTFYTMLDVPHNALLAKMPLDYHQRTSVSAWRYFFSSLGALTVAFAARPIVGGESATSEASAFLLFAVLAGSVGCLTIWQSIRIARELAEGEQQNRVVMNPIEFFRVLHATPIAKIFFTMAIINALTLPLFARMAPYLAKYLLLDPTWASPLFLAFTGGQILAMPIWSAIERRKGKASSCLLAYWLLLVALASMLGATLQPVAMLAITSLVGFVIGALNMLIWALAPDIVDRVETKDLSRPDAMFMSFLTLAQKSAIGIGSLLAGAILSISGFEADILQNDGALIGISLTAFGLPAAGAIIGIFLARKLRRVSCEVADIKLEG